VIILRSLRVIHARGLFASIVPQKIHSIFFFTVRERNGKILILPKRTRIKKKKLGDRHCPKPIPREIPQIRTFLEPWS